LIEVHRWVGSVSAFSQSHQHALQGLQVNIVTVADDVALASDDSATGRRGIAGTVLVHKLAGAAAEEGKSLAEVTRVARRVAEDVRTMGVALSPCIVPAVGKPTFTLPPNGMPP